MKTLFCGGETRRKSSNFVAGRSCACTDRNGDGSYGVFVANYGGPMRLYEMDKELGALYDAASRAGMDYITDGRALVSAPILKVRLDRCMDVPTAHSGLRQ